MQIWVVVESWTHFATMYETSKKSDCNWYFTASIDFLHHLFMLQFVHLLFGFVFNDSHQWFHQQKESVFLMNFQTIFYLQQLFLKDNSSLFRDYTRKFFLQNNINIFFTNSGFYRFPFSATGMIIYFYCEMADF